MNKFLNKLLETNSQTVGSLSEIKIHLMYSMNLEIEALFLHEAGGFQISPAVQSSISSPLLKYRCLVCKCKNLFDEFLKIIFFPFHPEDNFLDLAG